MKLRNIIIGSLLVSAAALSGCGTNAGSSSVPDSSIQETKEEKTVNITVAADHAESPESSSDGGNIGTNTDTGEKTESSGTISDNKDVNASLEESFNTEKAAITASGVWSSKDRDVVFSHDFTEDIKKDIAEASANASTMQDELSAVEKITVRYEDLFKIGEAQLELNAAAAWTYDLWDAELNSIWKRFSDSADAATKERVLKDEKNWIAMKEEVTLEHLGSREDGGSMYPLLEYSLLEDITKNRCYILASELAKIKGESFTMPERGIYGTYVDNQGTGDVYSSLIIRKGWENDDEAILSLYRVGETCGTITDKGNGELSYKSNDGTVKGIIRLDGWNGASFEVTDSNGSVLAAGDKFDFGFVF